MNALALTEAALPGASPVQETQDAQRAAVPVVVTGRAARVQSLSRSPRLLRVSQQAAPAANDLYGRESLRRTVAGAQWRFRWRHVTGSLAGVLLRLRIGSAELTVGFEDPGPFDAVADLTRPELPPELRVAYLIGAGAALWRELEAIMQCAVELVDVQHDGAMVVAADCVGFELGREPHGPLARGFVCTGEGPADGFANDPSNDKGWRILSETSRREMARARLPTELPVQWAAVAGSTMLAAAEVRALEAGDTVMIDDATFTAEALGCWLGAGVARRHAGRAALRQGQLHFIQFTIKGNAVMQATTSTQTANGAAGDPISSEAQFEEIQVNLRFELARWHAPLAEVAALAPGTVIDLGRRIDEQSVLVWAEQRCIGKGQLVALGDRLGVRLLTVFGSDGSSVAQDRQQQVQSPPPESAEIDAVQVESSGPGDAAERSG